MKNLVIIIVILTSGITNAQIDKEKLALDISDADKANNAKLAALTWKRNSTVSIDGEVKATVINEISFDDKGEVQATQVGGETTTKQKFGIRGKIQKNKTEDKIDYVKKALELSLSYSYMSKGQLLDFFDRATVTEEGGVITAASGDVYVEGDSLTVLVDSKTHLFLNKKFSSLLDKDPISGELNYETLSSGINHVSKTVLNLPAQKTKIDAENKDYSQRVK